MTPHPFDNTIEPGERKQILVYRQEPDFDRACDSARTRAPGLFGCDDYGHMPWVKGADRSNSAIVVEFVRYFLHLSMVGASHMYEFSAYVEVQENEDE